MLAMPQWNSVSARGDPEIEERLLWSMAPSGTTAGATQQMIRAYAGDRWLTSEQVSEEMGVSVRTLQRQLGAEGTTYSVLADETRVKIAQELLDESDLCLSEIAVRTGYSNLSNFNRAFRRWSGVSPGEFRAQRSRVPRLP